jgi:CO/xanthine dehydrogenase FAD-binding subunit
VKPAAFEYHRPASAAEAVELLASLGDDAKVLAGGQSLIPMLALRLTMFEHLVDIGRIGDLEGIERRGDELWIGAGTTEAAVEQSAEVAASVPLLAQATPYVGHVQIRNRGTVGGSLAHADPAAEYPAVALALDATFEAQSPGGARSIAAVEFFTGLWATSLGADELLTGVRFPVWSGRCGFAVEEIARRHGDFAIAGAVVAVQLDGADRIERCGIALIGMGSTPERSTAAEAAATGHAVSEIDPAELARAAVGSLTAIPSDLHGSAAYRERVGATMTERAWRRAVQEAHDA